MNMLSDPIRRDRMAKARLITLSVSIALLLFISLILLAIRPGFSAFFASFDGTRPTMTELTLSIPGWLIICVTAFIIVVLAAIHYGTRRKFIGFALNIVVMILTFVVGGFILASLFVPFVQRSQSIHLDFVDLDLELRTAEERLRLEGYQPIYDPRAHAEDQIAAAMDLANARNGRILLVMGGNWCRACFQLEDAFAGDERIKQIIDRAFVLVHVEEIVNKDFVARYSYPGSGSPWLVVLDSTGHELVSEGGMALQDEVGFNAELIRAFLIRWAATNHRSGEE